MPRHGDGSGNDDDSDNDSAGMDHFRLVQTLAGPQWILQLTQNDGEAEEEAPWESHSDRRLTSSLYEEDEDESDTYDSGDLYGELQYVNPDDDSDEDHEDDEEDEDFEDGGSLSRELGHIIQFDEALNTESNTYGINTTIGSLRGLIGRGSLANRLDMAHAWAASFNVKQTVADPRGTELLQSGEFGKVKGWKAGKGAKRPRDWERTARGWKPPRTDMDQGLVPNDAGTIVASYPSVPYVGQYAGEDYSIFYTATQYFTIHLYSTTQQAQRLSQRPSCSPQISARTANRVEPAIRISSDDDEDDWEDDDLHEDEGYPAYSGQSEDSSMKRIKRVQGVEGRWTVTDCDADRKGQKMIYSSITPYVHMLYTDQFDQEHTALDFSDPSDRGMSYGSGIWSVRFSADGKEVVAGGSAGKIMVYDIESQRRSLKVSGHADDVNAVCFADQSSTNILISGSDDGYVKIWDRRSLSSHVPSGVLVGATEGITYTSPKGDGRYIVVNSKDQAARLYDLRKMRSWRDFEGEKDAVSKYGAAHFDYRDMRYEYPRPRSHPKDCSVMTYRGHSVLQTLIRCHFSPVESTGQSYIYSGSADGQIHIWSLDGRVVQVLDRTRSAPLYTPFGTYTDPSYPLTISTNPSKYRSYTVRDVAWHGYEPTLMSTCWDMASNVRSGGTVAKHEWKGLGKMGLDKLEDWVEKERKEAGEGGGRRDL